MEEATMGWDEADKEYIQNFGDETFCKTPTCKTKRRWKNTINS
jgi:hypothetical protein